MFDDRLTRLDLRIGKRFALSERMRLQANFNVYNVFNGSASSVLNVNYGPLVAAALAAAGWPHGAVQRHPDLLMLHGRKGGP